MEFKQLVNTAIEAAPPVEFDGNKPIGELFSNIAAGALPVRRGEQLLTNALSEFPLHPYLLYWRARLRLNLMTEKGERLAEDGACEDLQDALEVAPNYLAPRFELAHLLYVRDDNEGAAEQFREVIDRASDLLASAAAGRIDALIEADRIDLAKSEMERWKAVFPDNSELKDAAKRLERLGA